ncbi:hypothetical protein C2I18_13705 [Paenibacillus sp. PK3_47]|uniref:hypothetical protein n=1 Tax=Paenibacillus sp. PK3_47 TaxID=2072642 RepID=UPI00201D4A21|nr:hypothetical protein [Paenibacillus sp. PK3_47]UQZ34480.1 hypothetical protein C2I18_13705 [Paenibacillus sp. PK3_47]
MERTGIHNEYEDIKAAALPEGRLPAIEVTGRVMARLRAMDHRQNTRGIRFAGKTAAFSGMMVMLLLVAVTAYAASEYIQIRNAAGTVKVQHTAPDPVLPGGGAEDKYMHKALRFAEPGQMIAYYAAGSGDTEAPLRFAFKEQRLTDYSVFLEEIKRTGAPLLPGTAGDYSFEYGSVYARYPNAEEVDSAVLYQETLEELKGRAKASADSGMFMKAVPWTEAGGINATYTKDGAMVGISASLLNGGFMQVLQQPDHTVTKVKVEGREVVYNQVIRPETGYHYLNWYNEKQDAYYTLSTYGDRELTKGQLLELAGDLIRGGL